jgi:EAL domain-containing protein (putative c-di-GMP-specific phosphodiesterase class I)
MSANGLAWAHPRSDRIWRSILTYINGLLLARPYRSLVPTGALPIAVNLAPKQFLRGDIVGVIERALGEHGVEPGMLEIEITESDAMKNPELTMAALRQLKQRGVRVAIDDFGTGYSSLAYLKRFPVHTLKLDRSFVNGLPADQDDVSIALAVVKMAHSLRLEVIAEGVETQAQRDFLRQHGFDQMQGYLLSRPRPPADCAELLEPRTAALLTRQAGA